MKALFLMVTITFAAISLAAQQPAQWQRVYTFDDSVIEVQSNSVVVTGKRTGFVTFRQKYENLQRSKGTPDGTFRAERETYEFNCQEKRARLISVERLDSSGGVVQRESVGPMFWRYASGGGVIAQYINAGCQLIDRPTPVLAIEAPGLTKVDERASLRATKTAWSFMRRLEQTHDLDVAVREFFISEYLEYYRQDTDTNWFFHLDRATQNTATPAELQRFYLAAMNAGYLTSVYLLSQMDDAHHSREDERRLFPTDVMDLIKSHPYTGTYRSPNDSVEYLADSIDNIDRMRRYTDLLEKANRLLREHVRTVKAERSPRYLKIKDDLHIDDELFEPVTWICNGSCYGLPAGTLVFEVSIPLFKVHLAEVNHQMKVIALQPYLN
ncbi:MAG: hypothetical protein ABIP75_08660 [Pyrinomonadaceae bacterium]